MESRIDLKLNKAGEKWLPLLLPHCRLLFEDVFLPSHDDQHHLRVWNHARSLLKRLDSQGIPVPEHLPEELIIAVFFHDTGLRLTPDERHGLESRKLCEEFFLQNDLPVEPPAQESLDRILHAVEFHDDKSLKQNLALSSEDRIPELLDVLTLSDDLDAFGLVGIYRYAEIYLLRNIAPEELPAIVSRNVRNRFENLRNSLELLNEFVRIQEKRYMIVYEFYLRLAASYASMHERTTWEPLLIGMIEDALKNRVNLLRPGREIPETAVSEEISKWFRELDAENYLT